MKIRCQACGARFKIADEKIPDQGALLPCPKCKAKISITKDAAEPDKTLDAMPAQAVERKAVPVPPVAPTPPSDANDPFAMADPFSLGGDPSPEAPPISGRETDPFGNMLADEQSPARNAAPEAFIGSESDEIDTFAIDPFGDDFSSRKKAKADPLAVPFSDPFAEQDPFGAPPATASGTDPFGAPPATASGTDPFAGPDPFGNMDAQDLFAAPAAKRAPSTPTMGMESDPFGMNSPAKAGAPNRFAPDPQAGKTATDDLFGMDGKDSFDFDMDAGPPAPAASTTGRHQGCERRRLHFQPVDGQRPLAIPAGNERSFFRSPPMAKNWP